MTCNNTNLCTWILCTAACMEKFPNTPRGVLGMAINGKLTELRLKQKKVVFDSSDVELDDI